MQKLSAGLLLFRRTHERPEILLVHPGGPYWTKQDAGSWSVPKGMAAADEPLPLAAEREFNEETGLSVPPGDRLDLGVVAYSGKRVQVWAIESDADVREIISNKISVQWPPRSGKAVEFPECDKAEWFDFETAKNKMVKGQLPFIDRLAEYIV